MIAQRRLSGPVSKALKASALIAAAFAVSGQSANWVRNVERTDASHIIGNPQAEGKLTEWVSYTCPACGNFSRNGEEVVKLAYVSTGKVKFEIRHIQRNVVDVAFSLAAWCGGAEKFSQNHTALMWSQKDWLPKVSQATTAQQNRWLSGPDAERRKAIASDLDLYAIMQTRGIGRPELDRCLSDDALADQLTAASSRYGTDDGIHSTPSFAFNDTVLPEVHSWQGLAPVLASPPPAGDKPAS